MGRFADQYAVFCVIRIVTMALRIAWARSPKDINLAIAAQIFVYVGTMILFIMNWFFAQRIVRAQHPRWGWSTPYRVVHRTSLGLLFVALVLLIFAAVDQFFTLDARLHTIDRDFQLAGQLYFAVFAFAPVILVFVSLAIPRHFSDKFGIGRLRYNIAILLLVSTILTTGAIFRIATAFLPPTPIRRPAPWYFSRACFYGFNFATEILVVIIYAVVRFDLRFHIPDGSRGPGDYSGHNMDAKEKRTSQGQLSMSQHPGSNETLHNYENMFEDTRTLAESLNYPSSTLAMDDKTGKWKLKRVSGASSVMSSASTRYSQTAPPTPWTPDRDSSRYSADAPPVPSLPIEGEWPLNEASNSSRHVSRYREPDVVHEIEGHASNGLDIGNALAEAMAQLEANNEQNQTLEPPPSTYWSSYSGASPSPSRVSWAEPPNTAVLSRASNRGQNRNSSNRSVDRNAASSPLSQSQTPETIAYHSLNTERPSSRTYIVPTPPSTPPQQPRAPERVYDRTAARTSLPRASLTHSTIMKRDAPVDEVQSDGGSSETPDSFATADDGLTERSPRREYFEAT